MAYGGSFPLGWNQSPSDWREWQWQLYQESLAEEEIDFEEVWEDAIGKDDPEEWLDISAIIPMEEEALKDWQIFTVSLLGAVEEARRRFDDESNS